jgi:hypothetical protein
MLVKDSIGHQLKLFEDQKPTATVHSILKLLFPGAAHMPPAERKEYFNALPLSELEKRLNVQGSGWAPSVEEQLKARGLTSTTYLKNYPREIRRFIERATLISPANEASDKLLPEWEDLQESVKVLLPPRSERLRRMLNEGITSFAGYDAEGKLFDVVNRRLGNMRSCFLRLGRQASARNMTPKEFGETVVLPGNFEEVNLLRGKPIAYYHCKAIWNELATLHPCLNLPPWGDSQVLISAPAESIPDNLAEGLDKALFDGRELSENTKENYRGSFSTFFGIVEAVGLSLYRMTRGLDARDAIRLFTMGIERSLLVHDADRDDPLALARRIQDDVEFRDQVIASMREIEGTYGGKTALPNPFVTLAINTRIEEGKFAAARQLIMRISTINRSYFAVADHHFNWISSIIKRLKDLEAAQKTDYAAKKKAAFANPRLWPLLLERLIQTEENLLAQVGSPTLEWAREVKYTCMMHVLFLYPMRRESFRIMQFEQNYDRDTYQFHFEDEEVKNQKAFRYSLPTGGRGRMSREIMDLYLQVARPILLQGRQTPFVFVPEQTRDNAGPHLRRAAMNDFMPDYCKVHFADILPAELMDMNPHIARHIVASYVLVVEKNLNLAAQLLNDDPMTVLKHYSDVLASSHDELLAYYEQSETPGE